MSVPVEPRLSQNLDQRPECETDTGLRLQCKGYGELDFDSLRDEANRLIGTVFAVVL